VVVRRGSAISPCPTIIRASQSGAVRDKLLIHYRNDTRSPDLDAVTAAALGETIGGLTLEALRPILARASRVAGLHGHRQGFYQIYEARLKGQRRGPSVLALYDSLPENVTLKAIEEMLSSSSASGFIRQLAAFNIIGAQGTLQDRNTRESQQSRLTTAFTNFVAEALGVTYIEAANDSPASARAQIYIPQDQFRLFVNALIRLLDDYGKTIAGVLQQSSSNGDQAISWAQSVLAYAVLESIEHYAALAAGAEEPSYAQRSQWAEDYWAAFEAQHSHIQLPDLDTRRSAPYKQLYVSPRLKSLDGGIISLDDLLPDMDRAVVLGDPGAGKSTLSQIIGMRLTENRRHVPFHIIMREIDFSSSGFSIVKEIERRIEQIYQLDPLPNLVERFLIEGTGVLIFDGLDELLDPSMRRRAAEIIEIASHRFPLVPMLVTCRYVCYSQAKLKSELFSEFGIAPFSEDEVREYVTKWSAQQEQSASDTGRAMSAERRAYVESFMEASTGFSDMRGNPLLLSFICVLYHGRGEIPRRRPQLFDKCVDLLLRAWDSSRGVAQGVADTSYELALAEVAERISIDSDLLQGVRESTLKAIITEHLHRDAAYPVQRAEADAAVMVEHCRGRAWIFSDAGLSEDGETLYAFTHSSFREYFYAWALTRRSSDVSELADSLYALLQDGQSQIAVQIAVHLFDNRVKNGGSRSVSELLARLASQASLPPGEARAALNVLVDAVAGIQLQTEALNRLCSEYVWQIVGPVGRPGCDLLRLVGADFRHSLGVADSLAETLASLVDIGDDLTQLRLCWLITNAPLYLPSSKSWKKTLRKITEIDAQHVEKFDTVVRRLAHERDLAWQLAARRGIYNWDYLAESSEMLKTFIRLFEPCSDSVANVCEDIAAIWLLRVAGSLMRWHRLVDPAAKLTEILGRHVRIEQLKELEHPELWTDRLRDRLQPLLTDGTVDRALQNARGWTSEVRLGLAYVTLACLDAFHEIYPSEQRSANMETYEGSFHRIYQLLLADAADLADDFYRNLTAWSPGQIWIPEWSLSVETG
jgi:hypothetical protein